MNTGICYEIRLARELGPTLAADFNMFEIHMADGMTTLRGTLPDQAALFGVLNRIRDLNLTLMAVTRLTHDPTDKEAHPDD